MALDPARLLATVRGRRLLWELLTHVHTVVPWWGHDTPGEPVPTDDDVLPDLHRAVASAAGRTLTDGDLDVALATTVDHARYWQPPESFEGVLARPAVRDALAPLATVVAAAAPAWWDSMIERSSQHRVRWVDPSRPPTPPGDPRSEIAAWRRETVAEEQRTAADHAVSDAPWSGTWWSTPGPRLVTTTRAARGLPAVLLALVEDVADWLSPEVTPVALDPAARVYEVTHAGDWAALVARHPLEVTHSRRFDWWDTTGRTGRWLLPDFEAVAERYDAVHVSVAGYLDTAGEAVPVPGHPDAATVLAGWSPDQTWWLRDAPRATAAVQRWERTPDAETPWDWQPVGTG